MQKGFPVRRVEHDYVFFKRTLPIARWGSMSIEGALGHDPCRLNRPAGKWLWPDGAVSVSLDASSANKPHGESEGRDHRGDRGHQNLLQPLQLFQPKGAEGWRWRP